MRSTILITITIAAATLLSIQTPRAAAQATPADERLLPLARATPVDE